MKLTVVTPEKEVLQSVETIEILAPGKSGELGILPGHAPMISALGQGLLKYRLTKDSQAFKELPVQRGFLEVRPDSSVVILAEKS